jgi:hypothetical protein
MSTVVLVGSDPLGFWNEEQEFFLAERVSSSFDTKEVLPFEFSDYNAPIVGKLRCGEGSFVEFCGDGKIRSSKPISFANSLAKMTACESSCEGSPEFALEKIRVRAIGEAFLPSEEGYRISATGYFLGGECVALDLGYGMMHPIMRVGNFWVKGDIAFCRRWPIEFSNSENVNSVNVAYVKDGYPVYVVDSPCVRNRLPYDKKEVEGVVLNCVRAAVYKGENYFRCTFYAGVPDSNDGEEEKEESHKIIQLDKESKWVVGIEERQFLVPAFYVVEFGEEFYDNEGLKADYRSKPNIDRGDFCELLGVYDDVGSVIWGMIFD